jgi:hypothetical protein
MKGRGWWHGENVCDKGGWGGAGGTERAYVIKGEGGGGTEITYVIKGEAVSC